MIVTDVKRHVVIIVLIHAKELVMNLVLIMQLVEDALTALHHVAIVLQAVSALPAPMTARRLAKKHVIIHVKRVVRPYVASLVLLFVKAPQQESKLRVVCQAMII